MSLGLLATLLLQGAAEAKQDRSFSFKAKYDHAAYDPDHVWSGKDFEGMNGEPVTIFEYQLKTPQGRWLVSQIWNADCSISLCPTRLFRVSADGVKTLVVDDMMHQVISPDDPQFGDLSASGSAAEFAKHPFVLSEDGHTLINGDYKFVLKNEAKQ
jgi:hypothetical protein